MKIARGAAVAAAAVAYVALAWVIAHRIAYPFDLEWLEGATLWHAQRLVDGQALYPAPSLQFVPHPYPPLYPALIALLARASGGVSYALGRALSVASFAGALAIGWRFVRGEGGSRAAAMVAMAIPCAAYVPTGAWIDLVRVDSLWLLLTAGGTTLAWRARRSTPGVAAAAALLVAAFFAKQTAAPFMAAVALGLVVVERRAALVFVAALALIGLPSLWALQRATGGWFWFYVFRVHHSHAFEPAPALRAPGHTLSLLWPAAPLVAWALWRQRSGALGWTAMLAVTGIVVAALGKGTVGGYSNAFIPAVYFSSLLIGVALATATATATHATLAWALALATLLWAPRLRKPPTPTADDRAREAALIAEVRAVDGEVWLPTRPWYARLAGKQPLAGEMAANDIGPSGVPIPGFDDALRARRFAAVVIDEPYDVLLQPLFARSTVRPIDGARTVAGVRRLSWWLVPR
jgi:hypothetical protein